MKKIFSILLLIVGGISILGYAILNNKLPLLSNLIFKQVELNVSESPDLIYSYYDQIGYINNLRGETPKSGELIFEGGLDIEHTFTQQEINSWISSWESEWSDLPFQNSGIKINEDGTVEATSLISVSKAEIFAKTLGYSQQDIDMAKDYLKYIPDPLPLYAKGKATIVDNVVDIQISEFKVGIYSLPNEVTNKIPLVLSDITTKTRQLSSYTNVKSAIVTPQGVSFVGTVPASVGIK